jgi:hypothetical protein
MPPLPTPFPLPSPGSSPLDTSALWDINNLSALLSAFLTVFELAKQNYILIAFVVLGLIAVVIWWMTRFVGHRDRNI